MNDVNKLAQLVAQEKMGRREFLKQAVKLGVSTAAASSLLAAHFADPAKAVARREGAVAAGLEEGAFAPPRQWSLNPVTTETVGFRGWQYRTDIVEDNVKRYNTELGGHVDYATITGDYPAIMENQFIARAPLDMLYANPSQACRYYDAGWIIPVDESPNFAEMKEAMYPNVRDAWTYKGKLLGLSYFVTTRGAMHVNLKKFDALGMKDSDMPKTWDELYDQLYTLRDLGEKTPFLPHWFTEWYGIAWAFYFETMNRGGLIADAETHKPLLTAEGPAGDTLRAWKKIWNDGLVPKEVLAYLEPDFLQAWGSGEYVYSPQQMYDLKKFNDERYSTFAGYDGLVPYQGQSWGLIDSAMYLTSSRQRTDDHTQDVLRFASWYGFKDHEGKFFVGDRWMTESMLFSAYKEVMESPESAEVIKASVARLQDYEAVLEVYANSPYPGGVWNVVWASEFDTWAKETLGVFLQEDKDVDETIQAFVDKINSLNQSYGI